MIGNKLRARVADSLGGGYIRQALERGNFDSVEVDAIIELLGQALAKSQRPRSPGGLSE